MDKTTRLILAAGGCVALLLVTAVCALGATALLGLRLSQTSLGSLPGGLQNLLDGPPTVTPRVTRFTPSLGAPGPDETLLALQSSLIPINDYYDLSARLNHKTNLPRTYTFNPSVLQPGAAEVFWVHNTQTHTSVQVHATLKGVSDHVYFWVEDELKTDPQIVQKLADDFEVGIYPTNRRFFGSEWTPGVDNDPHLYILYTRGLGGQTAGYFSSNDEYPPNARPFSNGHEMFQISADLISLDSKSARGVLAHEFQHMIHWRHDRNEELWLNEGFSDLAAFVNGYDVGGHDRAFAASPDVQLNAWAEKPQDTYAHYGASFLFLTYFLDRYGEIATQALSANPNKGMKSVDDTMGALNLKAAGGAKPATADDLFVDWTVTNYLSDPKVDNGRYGYHNNPTAPTVKATETIKTCPSEAATRDVSQYGADYIRINCRGPFNLHFEGATQTRVIPVDFESGRYAFWSNRGDNSDMTLTRQFDFSSASGQITLNYQTWFEVERDFDYVYLSASSDGQSWQILTTPSGTPANPTGNSFGWGYNGVSGGGPRPAWITEKVDLSRYAGKKVWLRFEYITDDGVNLNGFLLDDVSIPQIGYQADFENNDGGWQADGFVRIQNSLPQTYRLTLIRRDANGVTVTPVALNADNTADIPLAVEAQNIASLPDFILIVSGTSRYTTEKAGYRFSIK
jgi:hypothetical protein